MFIEHKFGSCYGRRGLNVHRDVMVDNSAAERSNLSLNLVVINSLTVHQTIWAGIIRPAIKCATMEARTAGGRSFHVTVLLDGKEGVVI